MKASKMGILTLSVLLGLSSVAPAAGAVSNGAGMSEQQIKVSSVEASAIDKEALIEKLHELFPEKYDFLDSRDFHVDQFYYPGYDEVDVERTSLFFSKQLSGNKYVHGNLEFVGEDQQLQHFYADPVNVDGAMYPAKVSQDEAKEVAVDFLDRVAESSSYRLREGEGSRYHWRNRTLTEPIEYEFHFEKLQSGVPVTGQGITVVVLGNGEIVRYNAGQYMSQPITYEANEDTLSKSEALDQMNDVLDVELRYIVEQNYNDREAKARLTYIPRPFFEAIHAIDGQWLVAQDFLSDLPERKEIEKLETKSTSEPKPITKEEVLALAESLLEEETESGTLQIGGVTEEKMGDLEVFTVSYSYRTNRGSSGTSFSVNKHNGEIIQFHDISKDFAESTPNVTLSYEQGLEAAVDALNRFAPYSMNNFAYPLDVQYTTADRGVYYYQFPLIKNGIVVEGMGLSVSVSAEDGSVVSFNNYPITVDEWPSTELAVSKDDALAAFKEKMDLTLRYQNLTRSENRSHFYLVYSPEFQDPSSYYDATKGEWSKVSEEDTIPGLSNLEGHWAEEEISYLVESNILTVADAESLQPNAKVSKGTALEVLVKSIFYVDDYRYVQNPKQSFENIDSDHPLYAVVELAVEKGIIDQSGKTLDLDAPISREELAYWFIRSLGLEEVAKHRSIYSVPFVDKEKISDEYVGYVALAYAFGIFQGDQKQQFRPQEHVSLAQLSVANFRFAQKAVEFDIERW